MTSVPDVAVRSVAVTPELRLDTMRNRGVPPES